MITLNPRWKNVLLIGSLLALSGCQGDVSDLEQYVQKIKSREPAPIEPIPAIKPYVRFIYPGHEDDPFDAGSVRDDEEEQPVSTIVIDTNRAPEFLERFPLDSLKMVGTVDRNGQLWALIRTPDGSVHRVHRGNYIGKNRGRILSVSDAQIKLQEIIDNGFGGYKERDNALVLFDPEREG